MIVRGSLRTQLRVIQESEPSPVLLCQSIAVLLDAVGHLVARISDLEEVIDAIHAGIDDEDDFIADEAEEDLDADFEEAEEDSSEGYRKS